MLSKLRHAVAPSVIVVLAAYGMAYAATGSPNPIDLVSHHGAQSDAVKTPDPSDSPDVSESPDPSESPEASETPEASPEPKTSDGPERSTTGCPDGFTGNHGQFVSSSTDHHAAAQSDCGKPVHPDETPSTSPSSNDNGEHVGHGDEQSPEPSESPEPDSTGDSHSNDHQGNAGTNGS